MSDKVKMILVGVVSLIVGAAAGVGYGMMQVDAVTEKLVAAMQEKGQAVQNADRLRKMNDEAVKKYGKDLGKLVVAAVAVAPAAPATDDATKLIDGARAILVARDGFRASLDGVRASMNSDLDALATEISSPTPNADKVKQLLDTLKQDWTGREKGMEDATRKLLVDLGLLQAPAAPKPAVAPAAAAPAAPPAAPAAAPAPAAAAPAAKK